jgi:hypothetical protein
MVIGDKQIKSNLYENKNEINRIVKNLDCNLPIDHPVSFPFRRDVICSSIISTDISSDTFTGSMDCVCRCAFRGFNCPVDLSTKREEINRHQWQTLGSLM